MLILVIVLFLICWGSRLSMEILIKVGLDTFSQEIYFLRIAINLLPYVHSCLNPFIYSLMSKNFRRSMWRRLHCCCAPCTRGKAGCMKRMERCTCQSVVSGAADNDHGQTLRCQHCQQFCSHYNLNVVVNVMASVDGEAQQDEPEQGVTNSRSMFHLRSIATSLTIATSSGSRTPANSPLLARLGRNRSMYANSVVTPECAQHTEVDCRV